MTEEQLVSRPQPSGHRLPPGPTSRRERRAHLRLAGQDVLAMFDKMTSTYGDVSMFEAWKTRLIVIRSPEAARRVLLSNQDNYPKSEQFEIFKPVLGEGLVTSTGEPWRAHRRLVQPLFAKRHPGPFADHMAAAAANALDTWEAGWGDNKRIDINEQMLRVGIDTVSRALASAEISEPQRDVFEAGTVESLKLIGRISRNPAQNSAKCEKFCVRPWRVSHR